jgi:hypothetical protein
MAEIHDRSYDDDFFNAYIVAALWSTSDDDEFLDDNHFREDIDKSTMSQMEEDCEAFINEAGHMIPESRLSRAGHDFWLTRNGHGAGFWDGDWPEHGDELTKISEKFGSHDLYVGDDGLIYGA